MSLNLIVTTRTEFADYERRMSYRRRLISAHGEAKAMRIIAGEDAEARADELAWRNIAQPRGARS